MNTRIRSFFVAILLALALVGARPAKADLFKLGVVGTLNFSNPRLNNGAGPISSTSTLGLGVGALAYFPIMPDWRLETGVLYVKNLFTTTGINYTFNSFEIPVVFRYVLLPFLSLGAGGYYSLGVGNVGVSPGGDQTYDSLGFSSSDIGVIVSAALDLPIGPVTSLLVDMRYVYGLKNLQNANNGETFRMGSLMFLAGLKFGI